MSRSVDVCLSWVKVTNGKIPATCTAARAGGNTFVARFLHNDVMTPGQVVMERQNSFATYGGCQETSSEYQVLCETPTIVKPRIGQDYKWILWSGHTVPENALIGGSDKGRPLYVARAKVNREWRSGKFLPEDGRAYFSCGGTEHEVHRGFEVLVLSKFYNFTHANCRGVDICLSWVDADIGAIPDNAVTVGEGAGGDSPVVARFSLNEKMRLGPVHLHFSGSVPSGERYQVLCKTPNPGLGNKAPGTPNPGLENKDQGYQWVSHSGSTVLDLAIIGGICHGKPQFVARANVANVWCTGEYLPNIAKAYVYHGTENQFEILVLKARTG